MQGKAKRIKQRRERRRKSVKIAIQGRHSRPRLCVFRSARNIYAQVIDDARGVTLAAASSLESMTPAENKVDIAKQVGVKLAERCKAASVEAVVFDRNGYAYHGRVRAIAESVREAGIKV